MTAQQYVDSIRNNDKRAYAFAYRAWLIDGKQGDAPQPSSNLSYMGAQAVRMRLETILSDKAS